MIDILSEENGVSAECGTAALTDLATCGVDASLATENGCCSKECADGIKLSISSGCFAEYAHAICTTKTGDQFRAGL
jgi:hypothetical protein